MPQENKQPRALVSGLLELQELIRKLSALKEKPDETVWPEILVLLSRELKTQAQAEEKIKKYQAQLRKLALELSLTEARERRAIAEDLHDHIGQALAFIRRKLVKLQGDAIFSGHDRTVSSLRELLEQTIKYTRNLTFEICPPLLYELGLKDTLDWLGEEAQKKYGLTIRVKSSGGETELSGDLSMFLYKAVRELVTNAAKHAEAGKMDILLQWEPQSLALTVKDDGKGFNAPRPETGGSEPGGFGLFSIKERLKCLGGTLEVLSAPGEGAEIRLKVPLDPNAEAADGN